MYINIYYLYNDLLKNKIQDLFSEQNIVKKKRID